MSLSLYSLDKVPDVYQSTSGWGSRNRTVRHTIHHGSIQFITSVKRERTFRTEVTITVLEPGLCSHPRRPLVQPPSSAGRTPEPSLRVAHRQHRSDGTTTLSYTSGQTHPSTFTLVHKERTQTLLHVEVQLNRDIWDISFMIKTEKTNQSSLEGFIFTSRTISFPKI